MRGLTPRQIVDVIIWAIWISLIIVLRSQEIRTFPEMHGMQFPAWATKLHFPIGLFAIFKNVLPKYLRFEMATRHLNDQKHNGKSRKMRTFMTKNYIRLAIHIVSGGSLYLILGVYLNFIGAVSDSHARKLSLLLVFLDFVHQFTIVLMMRNHDGIFMIRTGNFMAAMKTVMACELLFCNTWDEMLPALQCTYFATGAFSTARLFNLITYITYSVVGDNAAILGENWYSIGLFFSQITIFWPYPRHTLYFCGLSFFMALRFPHELWTKKNGYQLRYLLCSFPAFVLCILTTVIPYDANSYGLWAFLLNSKIFHTFYSFFLSFVSFKYCGIFYKREPLQTMDMKKMWNNAKRKVLKSKSAKKKKALKANQIPSRITPRQSVIARMRAATTTTGRKSFQLVKRGTSTPNAPGCPAVELDAALSEPASPFSPFDNISPLVCDAISPMVEALSPMVQAMSPVIDAVSAAVDLDFGRWRSVAKRRSFTGGNLLSFW